jgi:hypothetical protein
MIVLNAGGKGKQAWGAGRKKSPRRIQVARNVLAAFFIWDRSQRHEAIEQEIAARQDRQPSQRRRSSPRRNGAQFDQLKPDWRTH